MGVKKDIQTDGQIWYSKDTLCISLLCSAHQKLSNQ